MGFHDKGKPSERLHGEKVSQFYRLPAAQSTSPLIGWRAWGLNRTRGDRTFLTSIAAGTFWEGPLMTTSQNPDGGLMPCSLSNPIRVGGIEGRGDYGVYSYKTPDYMYQLLLRAHPLPVVGLVENSGHVIEHEYGYRAQKCMVKELWIKTELESCGNLVVESFEKFTIKSLESIYQCHVNILRNEQDYNHWILDPYFLSRGR